jgi:hypothetical protein
MMPSQDIPQDNRLPQMAVILDEIHMRGVLQEALNAGVDVDTPTNGEYAELRVRDCKIDWIKYKPDNDCTVCYRLAVVPSPPGSQGELILYGRIYGAGRALSRFHRAQSACLVRPKFGRPLLHLPELDMMVWVFPNDRRLTGLPVIADERRLKDELLADVLGSALGREWQIADMTHDIVHYVPEHACTIRLQLQVRQARTGDRRLLNLYGKTYYDDKGAETYQIMRELWTCGSGSDTQSNMAQPMMYDSRHRLLWQAAVAGAPLGEQDLAGSHFCTLMREAAVTVAWLHRSPVSCSRLFSLDDWLVKLEETGHLLAQARPSCRERIGPLIDRLRGRAGLLGEQPVATLHGDLHLNNLLEYGERVSLIDMDNICLGPPARDVGSFIAGVFYQGLLRGIDELAIQRAVTSFCDQYERSVPWKIPSSVLNWYIATSLLAERACRCVMRLKSGRLNILDDLIDLADRVESGDHVQQWTGDDSSSRN